MARKVSKIIARSDGRAAEEALQESPEVQSFG
jgi:hypothetical protein